MNVKFFHVNNLKKRNSVKTRKIRKSLHVCGLWAIVSAAISGCASAVPEDMPAWEIVIATPSFYSVDVTGAYGVNNKEDWTALTHGFSQLSNWNGLKKARKWIPEYDGLGIPLHNQVNIAGRQIGSGTNHLPDSVYIYWTSYIGQTKFYVTQYDVPKAVRQLMTTRQTQKFWDGTTSSCYQSDFVFGLLPNGHAKLWIKGCAKYTYITELPPEKEPDKDFDGFDLKSYGKNGDDFLKQRAKAAGVAIEPIPWDKVNKVYWNKKNYTVDSIEDYLPGAGK